MKDNILQHSSDLALIENGVPCALELEQAILGSLLTETNASEVLDILSTESFYERKNKIIFKAILELRKDGSPSDLLTVHNFLTEKQSLKEAGGSSYLVSMTDSCISPRSILAYSRIVAQKHIQRNLITLFQRLHASSREVGVDVFDLLNKSQEEVMKVGERYFKSDTADLKSLLDDFVEEYSSEISKGIMSGFKSLDGVLNGLLGGQLVVVGARPGMGKTSFALSMIYSLVKSKVPVAFFSIEMTNKELMRRLVCAETEIPSWKVQQRSMTDDEEQRFYHSYSNMVHFPLYLNDQGGVKMSDIRMHARKLKKQNDIKIIFVDYLQIISPENSRSSREQQITEICIGLASLSKELGIPIVVLSQLSRESEKRGDHAPVLSDLRDSGSIEQTANIVLFLHRPEYYRQMEDEMGNSTKGLCEVIIAKNRDGATGTIRLHFESQFTKFKDFHSS